MSACYERCLSETELVMIMEKFENTFGDFDFTRASEFLGVFPHQKWEIPFQPVEPSEMLRVNLRRAERQITTGSNEWEQRLFMELMFLEALDNHQLRMWQEKNLDAGNSPFRGKVDFAFTPYQARFSTPYAIVSEAKKDDFEQGWGQCLMALKTISILNEQAGWLFDVYGIVSSGRIWEFGKYGTDNRFYRSDAYTIGHCAEILGILDNIFTACDARTLCKVQ